MNREEWTRFCGTITTLALGLPPRPEVSELLFESYHLGLEGIPVDAIERAAKRALQTCKFMPSPAELRELAGDMLPADRAVRAWAIVERAVHVHGEGPSLDFDDPAVNATIHNMGGWEPFLDRWEVEGKTWLRKDFERVYQSFCRAGVAGRQCGRLVGFNERSNRFHGFLDDEGCLFGRDGKQISTFAPLVIECHLPPLPLVIEGPREDGEAPAMLELLSDVGQMPAGPDRRFHKETPCDDSH